MSLKYMLIHSFFIPTCLNCADVRSHNNLAHFYQNWGQQTIIDWQWLSKVWCCRILSWNLLSNKSINMLSQFLSYCVYYCNNDFVYHRANWDSDMMMESHAILWTIPMYWHNGSCHGWRVVVWCGVTYNVIKKAVMNMALLGFQINFSQGVSGMLTRST